MISRPFNNADYAAIEARVVNWLAGQEDALEEYRQGVDRYKVMASEIYRVPVEEVNKHPQRFVGKHAILACGYQGGTKAFIKACWKMGRYKVDQATAELAVTGFRKKHDKLVSYWYDVERAAQRAITHKGEVVRVSHKTRGPYKVPIYFQHKDIEGLPFLLLKLPSGRKLAYPRPRLAPSRFEGRMAIKFYGHIKGTQWGDVDTYGGKLVENITQAVAGDIMLNGAHHCERAGYGIVSLIHDEALGEHREGHRIEEFVSLLTRLPQWAAGLPLEAEGALVPFYKKD